MKAGVVALLNLILSIYFIVPAAAQYEDDIVVERLMTADEVMLMGTMSGPIAITHIDNQPIGGTTGDIGPVTKRLKELYTQAMVQEKNLFDILN